MPRVCKAVIKAKGIFWRISVYKIYLDLFNTFFVYCMIPYVLFHSFDVFNIILQNSKNKEKPWNEQVCQLLTGFVCI
jgi:hypothetical protein